MLASHPHIDRTSELTHHTLRASAHDDVALLATGATVPEAIAAADILDRFGIRARVIDLHSVQPLDARAVTSAANDTGNIIVAEDHEVHGGIGDAVLAALAHAHSDARVRHLAVHTRPVPRDRDNALWRSGVDRTWIATAARDLLEQPVPSTVRHRGRANGYRRGRWSTWTPSIDQIARWSPPWARTSPAYRR